VGIACYPEHGADPDTLLRRADVAMYAAKRNHSGLVVYCAKLDQHSPHRLMLMGDCARRSTAMSWCCTTSPRSTFGPVWSRRWRRWCDGRIRFTPDAADQFIALAESTGLINPAYAMGAERRPEAMREVGQGGA